MCVCVCVCVCMCLHTHTHDVVKALTIGKPKLMDVKGHGKLIRVGRQGRHLRPSMRITKPRLSYHMLQKEPL